LESYSNYKAFSRLEELTSDQEHDDYVSGYDFIGQCVWPVFEETLIKQMAFVFGLANLPLFHANYLKVCSFIE
jgi:hypothetical protein